MLIFIDIVAHLLVVEDLVQNLPPPWTVGTAHSTGNGTFL